MKIHHILAKSISKLLLRGAAGVLPFLPTADAGDTTWTGGGASNVWGDAGNWGGTNVFTNYGTVIFNTGGAQGTTSVVNGNISQNGLRWTGSLSWTLNNSNSAVISLFDNGGTQAKVENQSTGLVTLNAPITFAATSGTARGEINAVSGDLTFGSTGTLTVSGSAVNGIAMFGSGHTITFSDTINAATKWFGFTTNGAGNTAVINGTVTSGDW